MAGFAVTGSLDVVRGFARGVNAVVAAGAGSNHFVVVNFGNGFPG